MVMDYLPQSACVLKPACYIIVLIEYWKELSGGRGFDYQLTILSDKKNANGI